MKKSKILSCFCGAASLALLSPSLLSLSACGNSSTTKSKHIIISSDSETQKTLATDELTYSFSLNLKSAPSGGQQISVDKYYIMSGSTEGITDSNISISEVTTDGKLLNFTVSFTPPTSSNSKTYTAMFGITFVCKDTSTGSDIWSEDINSFKLNFTVDKKSGSTATISNLAGAKINSMSQENWSFFEDTAGNVEIEFSVASGYVYDSFIFNCTNCTIKENTTKRTTNKFYGIITWTKGQATSAITQGMKLIIRSPQSLTPTKFIVDPNYSPNLHIQEKTSTISVKCILKDDENNTVLLPNNCSLEISSSQSSEQTYSSIISIDDYNVKNTGIFELNIGFKTNDGTPPSPNYDTQYNINYDVIKVNNTDTGIHLLEQPTLSLTLDSEKIHEVTGTFETDGHATINGKTSFTWTLYSNQYFGDLLSLFQLVPETGYEKAYYWYKDSDDKEHEANSVTEIKDGRRFGVCMKVVELINLSGTVKSSDESMGFVLKTTWSCKKYKQFKDLGLGYSCYTGYHFVGWYDEETGDEVFQETYITKNNACFVAVFAENEAVEYKINITAENGSVGPYLSVTITGGDDVASVLEQITSFVPDTYYTTTGAYWTNSKGDILSPTSSEKIWENDTFTYHFQFDSSKYMTINLSAPDWNLGTQCVISKGWTLKKLREENGWTDEYLVTTLNADDSFYAGWYDENDNLLNDSTTLVSGATYYVKAIKTTDSPLNLDIDNLTHDLGNFSQKFQDVNIGKISIIQPSPTEYKRYLSKNEYSSFSFTYTLKDPDSMDGQQLTFNSLITSPIDTEFNIVMSSATPVENNDYYMILGKTYDFTLSLKINDQEYIPSEESKNLFTFKINDLTHNWKLESEQSGADPAGILTEAQSETPAGSVYMTFKYNSSDSIILDRPYYKHAFDIGESLDFEKKTISETSPESFSIPVPEDIEHPSQPGLDRENIVSISNNKNMTWVFAFDSIETSGTFSPGDIYTTSLTYSYTPYGSEEPETQDFNLSITLQLYIKGAIQIPSEYINYVQIKEAWHGSEVTTWECTNIENKKFIYRQSSTTTETNPFKSWLECHELTEEGLEQGLKFDGWYYINEDGEKIILEDGDEMIGNQIYYPNIVSEE